jgi:hypothetical protein
LGSNLAISAPNWHPALNEGVLMDITRATVESGMAKAEHPSVEKVLERGDLRATNPEMLPHVFQKLVTESGAQIQYFSTYTDSIVKNGKIDSIVIETPVGRAAVRGKVFIDCTGLATVAAESGAPVKRDEAYMGLFAWIGGVDRKRFEEYEKSLPKEPDPAAKPWLAKELGRPITFFSSDKPGGMNFPWDDWLDRNANVLGPKFREAVDKGEMPLFYKVGQKGVVGFVEGLKVDTFGLAGDIARPRTYITGIDPTDMKEVSEAHVKSSQYIFKLAEFLNKNIPGFENAQVVRVGEMTIPRAGRSIKNQFTPNPSDFEKGMKNDDAIAILQRGTGRGVYEIPYRAMLPEKIENLLAVGKSSAGGLRLRTHMVAVIMGQAAGTAAAVAVHDGVPPAKVDIRKLQAQLRKDGIPIPEK